MRTILTFLITLFLALNLSAQEPEKQRVFILTDIENEPDDAMSMIRFLTYSNNWDIEGLVATTSIHQQKETAAWRIREIVSAYGKVRNNLLIHESGYPTEEYLLSIIKDGRKDYGMNAVGANMDSEGSDWLIKMADKDERPMWVLVWGGPNCLAQALWKVRQTRTPEELQRFVSKLRVYTVSDQDDSGPWIRKNFPDLFYIVSPGYHDYGGYHYATWVGISGDKFHGRFTGADFNIVSNPWLDAHIRNKGPLGAEYPFASFLMEGDSPTFLYLINNGLSSPEHPNWGSWGGRYEYYLPGVQKWFLEPETRPIWTDAVDEVFGVDSCWHTTNKATIWRWRSAYQNDFEARMIWSVTGKYQDANHPPVVKVAKKHIQAKPGDQVELQAAATSDPDGNTLNYKWFYYAEPGTYTIANGRTGEPVKVSDADKPNAYVVIPKRAGRLGTMHFIVEVTDNGTPALTRYERVIVEVTE